MTLIPIAKPVRIRIKSGGEEHSSLESLKRSFCIEDIKPLLDGRLTRWLQRLGVKEQSLARELKNFDAQCLDQEEGMFAFIHLFFIQELEAAHLHSLQEVACHWINDPVYHRNGVYLAKVLVKPGTKWTDLKFVKAVYKQQLLPKNDWLAIFSSFLNQGDPELYFIYGKLLYEGIRCSKDETTGRLYITKATNLGWADARNYLKALENLDKYKSDEVFYRNREAVIEIIRKEMAVSSVNRHTPIRQINYYQLNNQLSEQFKITIMSGELSRYKTVGEMTDYIMTKIPIATKIDKTKLKKDLEQWKNSCMHAPYAGDQDLYRLNDLLRTHFDFELSQYELYRSKRNVDVMIEYVLSQYSK